MNDLPSRLDTTLRKLADRAPHDPALAETIRRRARLRRRAALAPLAAVLAVLVVLGAVGVIRGGRGDSVGGGPSSSVPVATPSAAGSGCRSTSTAVLPEWARPGFSPPYTATFATSRSGNLLAVLFGSLSAPPAPAGPTNKVLWIPRITPLPKDQGQVVITAHLDGTDRTARVVLPDGFGPSTVDLPAPGCWHVQLTSHHGTDIDELDLTYATAPPTSSRSG